MSTAVQLIAEHRNIDLLLLPTGGILFERGDSVSAL